MLSRLRLDRNGTPSERLSSSLPFPPEQESKLCFLPYLTSSVSIKAVPGTFNIKSLSIFSVLMVNIRLRLICFRVIAYSMIPNFPSIVQCLDINQPAIQYLMLRSSKSPTNNSGRHFSPLPLAYGQSYGKRFLAANISQTINYRPRITVRCHLSSNEIPYL